MISPLEDQLARTQLEIQAQRIGQLMAAKEVLAAELAVLKNAAVPGGSGQPPQSQVLALGNSCIAPYITRTDRLLSLKSVTRHPLPFCCCLGCRFGVHSAVIPSRTFPSPLRPDSSSAGPPAFRRP